MSQAITNLDLNFNQPTKFQMMFDRIANTIFYCTHVNIPGINLTENIQQTPFTDLPVPGDKILWQPLTLRFIVDVNYSGWIDIFQWMGGLGFAKDFEEYKNLTATATRSPGRSPSIGIRPSYSDATLSIYTNKNNPNIRIEFADCFPIGLDSIDMDYGRSADELITCSATFRYSYYTFTKLP